MSEGRGDVDDDATARAEHVASGRLSAEKRRGQVNVDQTAPVGLCELLRRDDQSRPGVVHQDMDSSQVLDSSRDKRLDLDRVAHVCGHRDRAASPSPNLVGHRLGARLAARVHYDSRSGCRQLGGDRLADPSRGPGDNRHPPG